MSIIHCLVIDSTRSKEKNHSKPKPIPLNANAKLMQLMQNQLKIQNIIIDLSIL